jgi:LmbE family N-acetylglucosaminyl deacetylase
VGLTNRQVQHTIQARHQVAAVIRKYRPDWLFAPYPIDAHPDHVATTRIVEDARFDAKLTKTDIPGDPWYPKRIIYYFCTHLRMNFPATFCVDISDTIDRKIDAVRCYASQFVGASGHVPEMVRTITAYFGSRIGTRHAEPFFTHETLGFSGLDQLVGGTGASVEEETPVMAQPK